jgi:hypothetical protein
MRILRAFLADRKGVSTIEAMFLVPVFLLVIIFVLEVFLLFMVRGASDEVVTQVSRLVSTDAAGGNRDSRLENMFKDNLKKVTYNDNGIKINTCVYSSMLEFGHKRCGASEGFGGPEEIVQITASYKHKPVLAGGIMKAIPLSTVVFVVNEKF